MFNNKGAANKENHVNGDRNKVLLQEAASETLFQIDRQVVGPLKTLSALQADDSKKQLLSRLDEYREQFKNLITQLSPMSEDDESLQSNAPSLGQRSLRGI